MTHSAACQARLSDTGPGLALYVTRRTDSPERPTHSRLMNTKKSLRCTIGRHRWQPTTVAGMRERICVLCGRNHFDASVHPDRSARENAAPHFIPWGAGGGGGIF